MTETRPMLSVYRTYLDSECGQDGYPWVWHERIKHEVREEAGNRCIRCGHPYSKGAGEWSACDTRCTHGGPMRALIHSRVAAWIPDGSADWQSHLCVAPSAGTRREAQWRILTVHHLNGRKHDCRWWNLVALCQRCHLQIQGKVQMARVWPWEHSEWFRPYVAGYYAAVYLGEELTRAEAVARMDELLALERAA